MRKTRIPDWKIWRRWFLLSTIVGATSVVVAACQTLQKSEESLQKVESAR